MKALKFLFFLIILGLLATLGYQNQDYFLTATALDLNVFSWHYTAKALPNWAFWGICLGLGLLITGLKGLFTAFRLGREIKEKDARISRLGSEINLLRSELEVFTHDPYIKKQLAAKEAAQGGNETSKASGPDNNPKEEVAQA